MGCENLEKEVFEKYKVEKYFKISGLKWETLKAIYNDYVMTRNFSLNVRRICVIYNGKSDP